MTDTRAQRLTNPWVVLFILQLILMLNYADRYLIAGLVDHIKGEFVLGDGFMGLLMGPAFATFYALLTIPIARIADVRSRVVVIAIGCLVWNVCTILCGLATGPWTLALARLGVGAGEAAFIAPAYSLLTAYFPPERRGRAFALFMLAIYFGQVGGYVVGPTLADMFDWRWAFILMGIPGIFLAAIELFVVREPDRGPQEQVVQNPPFLPLLRELLAARAYTYTVAGAALGTMAGIAFALWGPALFARSYGISMREASATFGLLFGVFALFGMLGFGAIADRITARRGIAPVLILSAIALLAATLSTLAVTWAPDFTTARLLAVPAGLLGGGWAVGVMAALQHVLPEYCRATGTAIYSMASTLAGFVIGPWVAGALSERLGDSGSSLQLALIIVLPVGFLGAFLFWRAARHLDADRERLATTPLALASAPALSS